MKTYLIDLFSKKTKNVITTYQVKEEGSQTKIMQLIAITFKSGKVKFKTIQQY